MWKRHDRMSWVQFLLIWQFGWVRGSIWCILDLVQRRSWEWVCHEIVLSGHLKGLLTFLSSLLVNFRSAKALLGVYIPGRGCWGDKLDFERAVSWGAAVLLGMAGVFLAGCLCCLLLQHRWKHRSGKSSEASLKVTAGMPDKVLLQPHCGSDHENSQAVAACGSTEELTGPPFLPRLAMKWANADFLSVVNEEDKAQSCFWSLEILVLNLVPVDVLKLALSARGAHSCLVRSKAGTQSASEEMLGKNGKYTLCYYFSFPQTLKQGRSEHWVGHCCFKESGVSAGVVRCMEL